MNSSSLQGSENFNHVAPALIWWGGLVLVVIGLMKLVVYAIGELRPNLFQSIRSETLKRFFTGRSNRLVFGLGGFITAAVGGFFMLAAKGLAFLAERLP